MWSFERSTAIPLFDRTVRESPAFAQIISVLVTMQTVAVAPAKLTSLPNWPACSLESSYLPLTDSMSESILKNVCSSAAL